MKINAIFMYLMMGVFLPNVVWSHGSHDAFEEQAPKKRCGGILLAPGRLSPEECPYDSSIILKDSAEPAVLFLNFDGGVIINKGADNPEKNESWIPDSAEVDIPPFDHEPYLDSYFTTREMVLDVIVGWARYYFAPFNVKVTKVRPEAGSAYQMMMIGGNASSVVNMGGGVVGVSPFDCGNSSKGDVNYTFSEDLGNLGDIVTTIVHENGHSLGLAHIDDTGAVMNPYVTYDPWWISGDVPDGQACDGSYFQDSYQELSNNLGETADVMEPWVDFIYPGDGATVPSNLKVLLITGDEDSLGRYVTLYLDGEEVAQKTWPYFDFYITGLSSGKHTLEAVVLDNAENTSTTTISVKVDLECAETEEGCKPGRFSIGDSCSSSASCHLDMCVVDSNDNSSWCSESCLPFTSSCAPGMFCVLDKTETNYYCSLKIDASLELKTKSKDHLLTCNSSAGRHTRLHSIFMLSFLLLGSICFYRFRTSFAKKS
jgi:hypothetical protein